MLVFSFPVGQTLPLKAGGPGAKEFEEEEKAEKLFVGQKKF